MGDLKALGLLVRWDLTRMWRRRMFIAMRVIWFTVQVSVFGLALSAMVRFRGVVAHSIDYYHFYLFGVYTSMLFSISVSNAYEVAEEFEEGIIEYHLSLPIKRSILSTGRALGGGIAAFIFTLPMYAIVLTLLGWGSPLALFASLIAALIFSVGVVGLVLSIVLSVKSGDATDILFGIIDAIIIRLSTIFYPAVVLAKIAPYYYAALANPISHFVDLLRTLFFFEEYRILAVTDPLLMGCYLLGFAAGLVSTAIYIVERKLEGGGWK
ncbi:MAG: ABC transporter permease [Thermofilaceae archaeon]|nr:ABC transporter permease [Thermofilaceae archaeon]MDW8003872.1 ABC transporter permease [Thermofilaceae archaeon]